MGSSPPRIILYKGSTSSFFDDLGGIGHRGFRTPLFFFDKHVNNQTYIKCLLDNQIPQLLAMAKDEPQSIIEKYNIREFKGSKSWIFCYMILYGR